MKKIPLIQVISLILSIFATIIGGINSFFVYKTYQDNREFLEFDAYYAFEKGEPDRYDIKLEIRNTGKMACGIVSAGLFVPPENFNLEEDKLPTEASSTGRYYKDFYVRENNGKYVYNIPKIGPNEQIELWLSLDEEDDLDVKKIKEILKKYNKKGIIVVRDAKGKIHKVPLSPDKIIEWYI